MRSRKSARAEAAPKWANVPDIESDAILRILGNGLGPVFEYMVIADDVLTAAGIRVGGMNALYQREFFELDPALYRHHCTELVARMKTGADLDDGTRAEVLIERMHASLRAPLNTEWAAVYETLFAEIMPEQFVRLGLARPVSEKWKGQVEEHIATTRRQLRKSRTFNRTPGID